MGWSMSATVKAQLKVLCKPRLMEIERCPYVLMEERLTACRVRGCGCMRSLGVAGMTLMEAPPSMRNVFFVVGSVMKRRQDVDGVPLAAIRGSRAHFPARICRAPDRCGPGTRSGCGTSRLEESRPGRRLEERRADVVGRSLGVGAPVLCGWGACGVDRRVRQPPLEAPG